MTIVARHPHNYKDKAQVCLITVGHCTPNNVTPRQIAEWIVETKQNMSPFDMHYPVARDFDGLAILRKPLVEIRGKLLDDGDGVE